MKDTKVSFHKSKFSVKPNRATTAMLSEIIADKIITVNRDNIRTFSTQVGKYGCTFCPATFKDGKRCKENFDQQQLFALDFDSGISFDGVKSRAEKYELPMLFAYDTFSSKNHDKFRAVFLNDVPITDRIAAEAMQKALGTIFPEADPSCYKDVSKMYYGGKGLLHFDDSHPEIDIEGVFRGMTRSLYDKYKANHYKEKIAKFADDTGIGLNKNGLLDVTITDIPTEQSGATQLNGKKSPAPIIYKIANGEIFPTKCYQINLAGGSDTNISSVGKRTPKNHNPYRSHVLNDISKNCKLFQEFDTGSRKLTHSELYGLATNLIQVDSGSRKFKDVLLMNSHFYDNKRSKWDHDLPYMKQQDYRPQGCNGFCPHNASCSHSKNILSTVAPRRGTIEKDPSYVELFSPVGDVAEDVYRAIHRAYHAGDKMFYIIKAQTAIGKTTIYLTLMLENPHHRFVIAVPTNILKNEVFEKAVIMGIEVMKTPSLDEIKHEMPSKVWKHIQRLYSSGQHGSVHPYICETLKKKDIPCLREYMEEREKLKTFGGSVITTHRYLLNMDEKRLGEYDAIIIDEDIIMKSIISNQGEITVSKLKKLAKSTTDIRLAKKIKKLLKLIKTESSIELEGFEWDDEEDDGISKGIDIPSFCLATHFYHRKASEEKNLEEDTIAYIKPVAFKDVKYIMVSATVNEKICRDYFGDDKVNYYECKKAKYKGTLNQYPGKSMSRSCIDEAPSIIERITEQIGTSNVITHKKYGKGPLYFGNTEGSNQLEGQDLLVIGTPYHAEFLYKLFAFTIGLDFDDAEKMKSHLVTHNGYRFRFTTYGDEDLRAIHFWMLESELEQAVGRARLLRYDCTVNLFSNYPLCQAELQELDYGDSVKDK